MSTLIRKQANPAQAGVLRGSTSPFDGDVIEKATEPVCPYCGGRESVVIDDETFPCWCIRDRADADL